VDDVLEKLAPFLEKGDIVIDGGNTHFEQTRRREQWMREKGLQFVGMGVSGGEEGARRGPALMPGGTADAWQRLKPILEAIAAKTDSGPCVGHIGPDGAGHFVKMVHNGIEYGDMQLIAECYDVMSRGLHMSAPEIGDVFARWNEGTLSSFLIDLTSRVLHVRDEETGLPLVDLVQDKAGQKGTGRWTAQVALDLGVPIPTIAAAIDARGLSSMKSDRVAAARVIRGETLAGNVKKEQVLPALESALWAARACDYAQGMHLIQSGSREYSWGVSLAETARIWTGGCIIRAAMLDDVRLAYEREPELASLLLDAGFERQLFAAQPGWRWLVGLAQGLGIAVPALGASLAYFDSLRTARLPQNLTQAQRDAFGAHTYERLDRPEDGFVHSDWLKD
jgi:6-phosphogluconate dehydrogenase